MCEFSLIKINRSFSTRRHPAQPVCPCRSFNPTNNREIQALSVVTIKLFTMIRHKNIEILLLRIVMQSADRVDYFIVRNATDRSSYWIRQARYSSATRYYTFYKTDRQKSIPGRKQRKQNEITKRANQCQNQLFYVIRSSQNKVTC